MGRSAGLGYFYPLGHITATVLSASAFAVFAPFREVSRIGELPGGKSEAPTAIVR